MKDGIGPHNIEAFIAAYHAATGDIFIFEGREVLKAYAKYVIEYFALLGLPARAEA